MGVSPSHRPGKLRRPKVRPWVARRFRELEQPSECPLDPEAPGPAVLSRSGVGISDVLVESLVAHYSAPALRTPSI